MAERLRGELEWFVSGEADAVRALVEALGPSLAERGPAAGSALIRASNSVGRFNVGSLGFLELRCGKWDEGVFESMLSDLTKVAMSLPFAADQAAGLPHDRALARRNDVLLHAFLYLRHIVLAPGRELAPALESILRDPHRRFLIERERVSLPNARRVDARTFERLAVGAEPLVRVQGRAAATGLACALRGHLPEGIDGPRAQHTLDTAENRFVRAFLDQIDAVGGRVERRARSKSSSALWRRIDNDCASMRSALRPVMMHDMWDDVAALTHLPMSSSVLQRRRGYRDVLRHHLTLRAATRLPLNKTELHRLLGLKDVASLYELWCFFAVVQAVKEILARAPDYTEGTRSNEVQVDVPWALKVSWGATIDVIYNLTFSRTGTGTRRSSSLLLRPDIVVCVRGRGPDAVHILDAKLRVDDVTHSAAAGMTMKNADRTFKKSDIVKMHAYRDALSSVRSAFVLYPGFVSRAYPALDGGLGGIDGVGAIALKPGGPRDDLRDHLRLLLPAQGAV